MLMQVKEEKLKRLKEKVILKAVRNVRRGYEELHQLILTKVPKYGNDDDYVDRDERRTVEGGDV